MFGCVADGPDVVCRDTVDVELGQRNVCLECHVTARPAPTSVHWQINHTDVINDDRHWAVVQVRVSVALSCDASPCLA